MFSIITPWYHINVNVDWVVLFKNSRQKSKKSQILSTVLPLIVWYAKIAYLKPVMILNLEPSWNHWVIKSKFFIREHLNLKIAFPDTVHAKRFKFLFFYSSCLSTLVGRYCLTHQGIWQIFKKFPGWDLGLNFLPGRQQNPMRMIQKPSEVNWRIYCTELKIDIPDWHRNKEMTV